MDLLIEVTKGSDSGKLQMQNVSNEAENGIIKGFFEIMADSKSDNKGLRFVSSEGKKSVNIDTAKLQAAESLANADTATVANDKEQKAVPSPPQSRVRQLPLIGAGERATASIADLITSNDLIKKEEEPEYWRTGIKVDSDGSERYKCRYYCGCGKRGNHYIPLDTDYVVCHGCEEEIDVQNATEKVDDDGVPERDSYGNFFVAKLNY